MDTKLCSCTTEAIQLLNLRTCTFHYNVNLNQDPVESYSEILSGDLLSVEYSSKHLKHHSVQNRKAHLFGESHSRQGRKIMIQ